MKMYLNNDLEITKFAAVFLTFSEQQLAGFSYIKRGTLNNQLAVEALIQDLAGATELYVYDLATLQLNEADFRFFRAALSAAGIELVFINELANVTAPLLVQYA